MEKKSKDKKTNLDNVRHSLSHLLAAAVLKKFPDAKLGIGPVIENGFYYDFLLSRNLIPEDLKEFEKEIRKLIEKNLNFAGKKVTATEAKKTFKNQLFKLELIRDFVKEKKPLTIYKTGDTFTDLCRGGHVKSAKEINPDAFKLTNIAGAYWKGNEKNAQLQRIYGVAFEKKKELDDYLKLIEEAKKRDHKKLGIELDLFTFSDLVGSGLPLWTPKGTIIRDILDDFVWQLRKKYGYERVDIPHLAKKELYEKSGHWQKFQDGLFKIKTREGHLYTVKPMNCPHHAQIYARKMWSYRELPQRYASTTKVYRDEQSGELSGLSRVLAITQDDAHVFCRNSQVKKEILNIWDIIETFYRATGFELTPRLSLHDPKQMEKYLGKKKTWQAAENSLREIVKERGAPINEAVGEAAFYGPKIDFMAKDSLNREWQVATIQLDMNLPLQFDLNYTNEGGKREQVIMIHAAIMGSIERFLSVIIEHYAGAFPLWLAPIQVKILNITDRNLSYTKKVADELNNSLVRVEVNDRNESVGKKIREAELEKVPYILVVGDKEEKSSTVAIRVRSKGDLGSMQLEKFKEKILKEIADKT